MRRGLLLGLLGVGVVLGGWFAMTPINDYRARSKAEGHVRAKMRDPDAAKFSNVTLVKVGGMPYAICGSVNGKNAYGAYSGPRLFYQPVDSPVGGIILPGGSERGAEDYTNAESMMATLCSNDASAVMGAAQEIVDELK